MQPAHIDLQSKISQQFGASSLITEEALGFLSSIAKFNAMIGGLIKLGRVIEVNGDEGSGKTTFGLTMLADAEAAGLPVAVIDAEHTLDIGYARKFLSDEAICLKVETGESAFGMIDMLLEGGIKVILVDSAAALCPASEKDSFVADIEAESSGVQGRLMAHFLRKLNPILASKGACVIFTNQMRYRKNGDEFEPTSAAGKALKFYKALEINMSKINPSSDKPHPAIKDAHSNLIGWKHCITTGKNKGGFIGKSMTIDLIYGKGFDVNTCNMLAAIECGVATRNADKVIEFAGSQIGTKRGDIASWVTEHPDMYSKLKAETTARVISQYEAIQDTSSNIAAEA